MKITNFKSIFFFMLITFICNAQTSSITYYGLNSGTLGSGNAFFGYRAGYVNNSTGNYNTFIGHQSGISNTSGDGNTSIGYAAGSGNATGLNNVFIGNAAGAWGANNSNNVFIGSYAGFENQGSGNIFIGREAGLSVTEVSNELHITNHDDFTPLIWGNFASDELKLNGKVGIGMNSSSFPTTAASYDVSNYKLIVNGGVLATEVRVATTWADYVFEDDYELPTLEEVECYIEENGHLPNVPTAQEVEEDGIEIGEISKIQQEKIEELTLYAIQQQKQIDKQQQEIEEITLYAIQQQKQIDKQQHEIEELKAMVKALADKE